MSYLYTNPLVVIVCEKKGCKMKRKLENDNELNDANELNLIQPEPPKRSKDNKYYEKSIRAYYNDVQTYNKKLVEQVNTQVDYDAEVKRMNLKLLQYDVESKKIDLEKEKIELEKSKKELTNQEKFMELSYKRENAELDVVNTTVEDMKTGVKAIEKLGFLRDLKRIKTMEDNEKNFEQGNLKYHS